MVKVRLASHRNCASCKTRDGDGTGANAPSQAKHHRKRPSRIPLAKPTSQRSKSCAKLRPRPTNREPSPSARTPRSSTREASADSDAIGTRASSRCTCPVLAKRLTTGGRKPWDIFRCSVVMCGNLESNHHPEATRARHSCRRRTKRAAATTCDAGVTELEAALSVSARDRCLRRQRTSDRKRWRMHLMMARRCQFALRVIETCSAVSDRGSTRNQLSEVIA
jgi:hypothetical protein